MDTSNKNLAHDIAYHPKDRIELFRSLNMAEQLAIYESLTPHVQHNILENLTDSEVVDLLDEMDIQHAERALVRLKNPKRQQKLAKKLKQELKDKAEYFLRFHPKAIFNLVNFNYLFLSSETSIRETASAMNSHYKEVGKWPEILVHKNGEFIGEVQFSDLIIESNNDELGKYVKQVETVHYQAEIGKIVESFNKNRHKKVVVLDSDGSVIGIIYSDDALALFGNKPAAALYDFAGVSETEKPFDSFLSKVRHRYKWLILNLATAFMAAFVVGLFENTLSQLVILAIYMPIIAGMGGNAATQTLAVIVRGLTIGDLSLRNSWPVIINEVSAGFVNGIINGIIVAFVAILWNGNPLLGMVLALAMIINLLIAGLFGALIPLIMKALGKDPATSATIFITTATDVFGFFAFLGLATLILL